MIRENARKNLSINKQTPSGQVTYGGKFNLHGYLKRKQACEECVTRVSIGNLPKITTSIKGKKIVIKVFKTM